MAKYSFGMSSWDAEVPGGKKNSNDGGKRDVYMRLNEGSNRLRILTKPFQYNTHKYKEEGDAGFGDKILCSASKENGMLCPLCVRKDRPKQRWFVGIIDRKTNEYKILDLGSLVFQGLKTLNQDEDWGDPTGDDFDIKVNKSAPAAGYYTVTPKSKSPLTEADLKLKADKVDEEHLLRKCTPPTPEWTLGRLNTIREKQGKDPVEMLPEGAKAPVVPVQVDKTQAAGDEDDDLTFPQK